MFLRQLLNKGDSF